MARDDLKPLPQWKQAWRRSRDHRLRGLAALKSMVTALVTLAISVLGAILISLGVYRVYSPAGYVVAGLLVFALQWSHEKDKEGKA